jgi:hypothetical protein
MGRQEDTSTPPTPPRSPKSWTAEEKYRVVIEAAAIQESDLGEFLRTKGLHAAQLEEWRRAAAEGAKAALGGKSRTSRNVADEDLRAGPKRSPKNQITEPERAEMVEVANMPRYRELSPKQIVPKLADEGVYLASESSFYRVLREEGRCTTGNARRLPCMPGRVSS